METDRIFGNLLLPSLPLYSYMQIRFLLNIDYNGQWHILNGQI